MKKKMIFSMLCIFLFVTGCAAAQPSGGNAAGSSSSVAGTTVRVSGDYQDITIRDFFLHNNVWGKENITAYSEEMYCTISGNRTNFGWTWNWPSTSRVVAYPEIIYGKSLWYPESTTPNLPRPYSNETINVDFSAVLNSSGSHNLAFDIWLCGKEPFNPSNATAEVMIWTVSKNDPPWGTYQGTYSFGGKSYKYYLVNYCTVGQPVGYRYYIAFIATEDYTTGTVPVGDFLKFLSDRGDLNGSKYLTSIEFGTEIFGGSGSIDFSKYQVTFGNN